MLGKKQQGLARLLAWRDARQDALTVFEIKESTLGYTSIIGGDVRSGKVLSVRPDELHFDHPLFDRKCREWYDYYDHLIDTHKLIEFIDTLKRIPGDNEFASLFPDAADLLVERARRVEQGIKPSD